MSDRTLAPGFLALTELVRAALVADHKSKWVIEDVLAFTAVDALLAHPQLVLDALIEAGAVQERAHAPLDGRPVYVLVEPEKEEKT